ncbi:MAG TPA: hypothetical protein VFQ36_12100 [Ktedonobacteraceae bacterium]|nr:hypothetical protein [Ktedonobacteraceae bacterium]
MQGRQGQGRDPWDRTSRDSHNDALNGSGKQRAVPQRPPRMARLDTPPTVQRVARPQRQKPRKRGRRFLIAVIVLAIGAMLVFVIAFGLANYFVGIGNSAGPANTAADFLVNLKSQTYDQAYKDLDATITGTLHPEDFQKMAQADDHCYGPVTDFNEVSGSATQSTDGKTQSFTYTMTRGKLAKTYPLTLTLQKDSNGNWNITSFGNDLGPAPPTCA